MYLESNHNKLLEKYKILKNRENFYLGDELINCLKKGYSSDNPLFKYRNYFKYQISSLLFEQKISIDDLNSLSVIKSDINLVYYSIYTILSFIEEMEDREIINYFMKSYICLEQISNNPREDLIYFIRKGILKKSQIQFVENIFLNYNKIYKGFIGTYDIQSIPYFHFTYKSFWVNMKMNNLNSERLNYIFERHSISKVKRWVKELKIFYYMRSPGGILDYDDEFETYILYSDFKDLLNKLNQIGIDLKKVSDCNKIPEVVNEQTKSNHIIKVYPDFIQPNNTYINGTPVFIYIGKNNFLIKLSKSKRECYYDVTDEDFENCKQLDLFLTDFGWINYVDKSIESWNKCISNKFISKI